MPGSGKRLRGISGAEAIRALERLGYRRRAGKGSHVNVVKPGSGRLTIPLHDELSVGLLQHELKN
ncbi:MAG: addiction module toxin, HicA family [Dehalococcoidia bacterium]|nr:addiction module toxin, HicA family [Dehalococcoidia bacterium]